MNGAMARASAAPWVVPSQMSAAAGTATAEIAGGAVCAKNTSTRSMSRVPRSLSSPLPAPSVAAVLAAGARAAQVGTAFMLCPEAGTAEVHRQAIADPGLTRVTRAFTGRSARGIENAFIREHPDAPEAYPELHHMTWPVRARGREHGDPELLAMWAGQAHELARAIPAADVVAELAGPTMG